MRKSILFFLIFIQIVPNLYAQNNYPKKYVTLAPDSSFSAGWFNNLFLGAHWRDLWATPITIEILDLDKFAGGLTPIKMGGGFQTKSLRFHGNDGHIWKFRSMDKDPSKLLPEILKETIAADILKDQISSANPAAPLVVAPFLDSVGVINSSPYLVFMPNSEKLGEFQEIFGGIIGYLEIHPDVEEEEGISYNNADKAKTTFKLFHRLEEERDEKVNSAAYLTARLLDIFLGDWDRHADQWKWIRYTENGRKLWYPIPRDRDQAFAKFDGLFPWVSTWFLPQFNDFSYSYGHEESLTWNGRFVDRRYLTELTKAEWDSVAVYVKSKLTDNLIEYAVKQLPGAMYDLAKDELEGKLKSRRDELLDISEKYYKLMNHIVDIYTSNKNDYVLVDRISDDETKIEYYKKDKDTGLPKGNVIYSKVFDNNLVDEFRISTLDGKDKVVLRGEVNSGPLVRIITGEGKDEVIDSSKVNGYFLSITPFRETKTKTIVYDSGKKTEIIYGPGTKYDNSKVKIPETDEELYRPTQRDRRNEWLFIPLADFTSDDGLVVGIEPTVTKYDFRKAPYAYKLNLSMMYSTKINAAHVQFDAIYKNVTKKGDFKFTALFSSLVLTKYFGYGNETFFNRDLEEADYFRLKNRIFSLQPSFVQKLNYNNKINVGASVIRSHYTLDNKSIIENFPRGDYGLGEFNLIGFKVGYQFNSRDNNKVPYNGFYFKINGFHYPAWWDVAEAFSRVDWDARTYFTFRTFTRFTLALRTGGEWAFNNYPFFAAAFLGGSNSLRGYSRERFSGDGAVFGQVDLRFKLSDAYIVLPGELGGFLFFDAGRVYTRDDSSTLWHNSFGGGLTISYFDRMANILIGLAFSSERATFTTKFKMMF